MNKFFKRLVAYFIDILILSFIVSFFSNIPFINTQLNNYNKYSKEYQEEYEKYLNFSKDLTTYYKDNKLTVEEKDKLLKDYKDYKVYVEKYYKNDNLTENSYKRLINDSTKYLQEKYKNTYYYINKYSTITNLIYIVVILLYFVGLNILLNGQTFGKRIMKLRIVSNNDKKITYINYLIRSIILYNPIYYLSLLVGPYIFNINNFYNWGVIWSNIKNYLEIVILMMIFIRKDRRGLHELLSNTKVVSTIEEVKKDNDIVEEKEYTVKKKIRKNRKIVIDHEDEGKEK